MFAPETDWGADAKTRALFTTRQGGVGAAPFDSLNLSTRAGDAEGTVLENRRRVESHLPSPPKWLRQVHGACVVCADDVDSDSGSDSEAEGDGAFTFSRGVVCAVLVADCLPVFLCAKGEGVAMAHAGWRGLAGGILERAYAALRSRAGSEIVARIGPGISQQCYPVGEEVRAALSRGKRDDEFFSRTRDGKFLADLKGLARARLLDSGASRVTLDSDCTFSDSSRYFSARRDGTTGRMAGLIWRE